MKDGGTRLAILDRECVAFTTYLTGRKPDEYVLSSYREAHERGELARAIARGPFDRLLVRLVLIPLAARVVDVYTALFFKRALVRKKLVLALAILESSSPSYRHFEVPDSGGRLVVLSRLAARSLASLVALVVAALLLAPAHAAVALLARASRES
jgi:hypothetical protein